MQKRFRKVERGNIGEVWVDVGVVGYRIELYENGEFISSAKGRKPRSQAAEVFLTGTHFAALLHIQPAGEVRCTWSR